MSIYNQRDRDFEFRPGPVFANVLLVDEINRAMPKTQSALLEAMAERQVTVDGETRILPHPFLLLATENPIEHEGTFPLPEAQLDRFFLKTALGYPAAEDELRIIREQRSGHPLGQLEPAVSIDDVLLLQEAIEDVYVDELVERWIVDLVRATRALDSTAIGASVRGSLALERAARAWALMCDRDYVTPADVEHVFLPVLGHRVAFTPAYLAEMRRHGWDAALDALPRRVPRGWRRGRSPATPSSPARRPAVPVAEPTFPLVLRRRLIGLAYGAMHSARRGMGSDVAGLAAVPAGGRHRRDRLGRFGATLVRARPGRVHRARAFRRGGAARRPRLRPPAGDGALPAGTARGSRSPRRSRPQAR